MSAAAALVKTSPARKRIEQLKPQPQPEWKSALHELEAAVRAMDRLAVVCGCPQSLSEGRGQSQSGNEEKYSEEERAIVSEEAITVFLQASIEFEETQNRKSNRNTNMKTNTRKIQTSDKVNYNRRRFLGTAAMTVGAAEFGIFRPAQAQSRQADPADVPSIKPGTNASFASMKQIEAGVLNSGYAEAGPMDGPVVVLLHGWPYDIYSFVGVAPLLASAGYRVIVPYLRGYGTTRFLSTDTFRNGQQSVVALDIIALMDALKIEKAIVAGFDWGARTANIMAALWPERCKAMVSVSGYLIGSPAANKLPLPPKAELAWWYQYYFATERGRAGYGEYRRDFAKLIWQIASPKWDFDDATFDRTAASFDNPDHVNIVIHNYRWRIGLAEGDPKHDDLEKRLAEAPVITVPTITLEGDANGAPHPDGSAYAKKFSGRYAHRILQGGIGHNLPQEAPQAFAQAIVEVDGF
ncbi:MAG TPA: alpha/beta hydrolase [Candidatus Baltobacteraceae bacterium]|jgi:pimeloyl-ACP methyl ester carboxylesterase|nr:alpha/beta hydrolase [Candidatus Baltobacteraceae bacterium]